MASLALLASGCGIGLSGASFEGSSVPESDGAAYGAADGGVASPVDAGKPSAVLVGSDAGPTTLDAATAMSPLCPVRAADAGMTCDPDDVKQCAPPATADAGVAAYDAGSYGCHITPTEVEAGTAAAMATCSAAGTGIAESPCYLSSDCAPGFECVSGDEKAQADSASNAGAGVCRRYCCDNECGPKAFCEIESARNGTFAVPVCAPRAGSSCKLLDDATCPSGQTCQVVDPYTGEVACVMPGTATAGGSCETANCAKGLSCILGYFPARECAQLCLLETDTCPAGETCTTSAAISSVDSQVGTCSQ